MNIRTADVSAVHLESLGNEARVDARRPLASTRSRDPQGLHVTERICLNEINLRGRHDAVNGALHSEMNRAVECIFVAIGQAAGMMFGA